MIKVEDEIKNAGEAGVIWKSKECAASESRIGCIGANNCKITKALDGVQGRS